MEEIDDVPQSPNNMIPLALAALGVVLGAAGLYFGLTANQRLNPITESVESGSSSSARFEKQISKFETQIAELDAQLTEQNKTIGRLRVYSSQGEQAVKNLGAEIAINRNQIEENAAQLNPVEPVPQAPVTVVAGGGKASSDDAAVVVEVAAPSAPTAGSVYTITSGDTFARIAAKTGVSVQALLDANPDADPRRLGIGQAINIPAK